MDAHEREYTAAAAGMVDAYGVQRCADDYAIGDSVTYRLSHWGDRSSESGQVTGHSGNVILVRSSEGELVRVLPYEILPF